MKVALIDRIHAARLDGTGFIVINPGGLTHTASALRDALAAVAIPFFEVHVSNVHKREAFRHHSFLSEDCGGRDRRFGVSGYTMALNAAVIASARSLGGRRARFCRRE